MNIAKCALAACVAVAFLALAAPASLAVDTAVSKDAPDLTAVRAKIKAKEFKSAVADPWS